LFKKTINLNSNFSFSTLRKFHPQRFTENTRVKQDLIAMIILTVCLDYLMKDQMWNWFKEALLKVCRSFD